MSRRTLLFIRWGVFLAACTFLYLRASGPQGMQWAWAEWVSSGSGDLPGQAIGVVLLLMVLNWGCEAWKWQRLMRPVQAITFGRAFVATLAGTTIGLITPNRVGEFAGRVLFLAPDKRVEGSFATLPGSIAQLVVTLCVGALSMVFGRSTLFHDPLMQAVVWTLVLAGVVSVFLYFNPDVLGRFITAVPFLRRFGRHASVLQRYTSIELLAVLGIAFLRYGVFTLQMVIMVRAIAGVPYLEAFAAVPLVYLVTTLIPTTALTELGVRGSAAVHFIPGPAMAITIATMLIWVINILLPAALGSCILLFARISSSEDTA